MRQKVDIKIADKFVDLILKGSKISTVRKGIRSVYTHDKIVFTSELGRVVEARCTEVDITTLDNLADEDAIRDGFNNLNELIAELRVFYPDMKSNETVTIIHFKKI